jgi:hypothetical protein
MPAVQTKVVEPEVQDPSQNGNTKSVHCKGGRGLMESSDWYGHPLKQCFVKAIAFADNLSKLYLEYIRRNKTYD